MLVHKDHNRQTVLRIVANQTAVGYNLCGQASQFHASLA